MLAVGVQPFLYVAIEHAFICLVFVVKWTILRENPLSDLRRTPLWLYGAGLFGITLHQLTWVAALRFAPPLEATLIIYTWPLMVVLLTTLTLGKKLHAHHFMGCGLGLLGIAVLMTGKGLSFDALNLQVGHFLAFVCAISWSLFAALSARVPHVSSNFISVVCGASLLVNTGIWYFVLGAPAAPASSIPVVVIVSVFAGVGYLLWDNGIKHGNTRLIAIASFLTPVLASFHLFLLGRAELTVSLFVALSLIVAGIIVAKKGDSVVLRESAV